MARFECPKCCDMDRVYSPVLDKEGQLHRIYLDPNTGKAINADAMPPDVVKEAEQSREPFCGKCAERCRRIEEWI